MRAARALILAWLALGVAAVAPGPELRAAPAATTPAGVVLQPQDIGPDFVLATSGQRTVADRGVFVQTLVRGNTAPITRVAPEGTFAVWSLAAVTSNSFEAERAFAEIGGEILEGVTEVPLPPIGDRARGGSQLGEGPFDSGARVIVFRAGSVVGVAAVIGFDAPDDMSETIRLAQLMAQRARS